MAEFNKSKKLKLVVVGFIVAVLLLTVATTILVSGKSDDGYRTITVIEVSGTVGVVHNDIEYAAYSGMHLEDGYSVVTSGNSYIRMLLDDDKYVKLEAGSKAVFEEVSNGKTAIRIERGSLVSEITKPLAIDEDFIVNTPNAVLAVRGTLFRVDLYKNEKGEINTDVMTYGGAVASKRVQPNGDIDEVEVTIKEGFKATVNMDSEDTVYVVDDVKVDIGEGNNKNPIITDANGEEVALESVLMPIKVEDIPDDDLVDIYFASENGHSMFIETEDIASHIEKREIDVTQKDSVYDIAQSVNNPTEIVIPDDNVSLIVNTDAEEVVGVVQGPPTDGLGENSAHIHKQVTEIIHSTCIDTGKKTVTCSECNIVISETTLPLSEHTANVVTVNATCISKGRETATCTVCGEVIYDEVLTETAHKTKTDEVLPTCTENGKKVVTCTVCGVKISETVTEATGHTLKTDTVNPTCKENGKKVVTCTVCGVKISETVTEATGHTLKTDTVNPTCKENGKTVVSCIVCGEKISETIKEANGHTTETIVVNPTCTKAGSERVKCTVCQEIVSSKTLPATGHTEVDGGVAYAHTKCSVCNEVLQSTHEYSEEITKVATCTEDGTKKYSCPCGYNYETTISAVGHTEEFVGEEDAHTKCSVCGDVLKTEHEYTEETVKQVTCKEDGIKKYNCTCGYSYEESVAASGHIEVNGGTEEVHKKCYTCGDVLAVEHDTQLQETVNRKEDCTNDGLYTYTCSCGYSYTKTITKTGHSFGEWVTVNKPTCEETGERARTCGTCGEVESEAITSLGHTEKDAGRADAHAECSVCGEVLSDGTAHVYTDNVTIQYDCDSPGEITHVCSCGWSYAEETSPQHKKSVDGSKCEACGKPWVDLNDENFPDSMFLAFVTLYNTDRITSDNALIGEELTDVTEIDVSGDNTTDGGYVDLTGIKNFTMLTTVDCAYNSGIETLDLSGLTSLTTLDVTGLTQLKELNVSGCTNLSSITGIDSCTSLEKLNVSGTMISDMPISGYTALTSLDVSNTKITTLNADSNVALESVNLSGCSSLTTFTMSDNSIADFALEYIDLTGCNSLTTLKINNALRLASIDFTDTTAIEIIDVGGCQGITGSVNVSGKSSLTSLTMGALTKVTNLNLAGCTSLEELNAAACTSLTTVSGLQDCTSLTSIAVNSTGITSLDLQSNENLRTVEVSNCSSLTNLDLMRSSESTTLSSLNITRCTALRTLNLYNCSGITVLNTDGLTALEELNLSYSGVKTFNSSTSVMDFSSNEKLKNIYLNGVSTFSDFTLTSNTYLEEFVIVDNNNVASLDFSGITTLKRLVLSEVPGLSSLNIADNRLLEELSLLNTGLTSLEVSGKPNIYSLQIYSNANLSSLSIDGCNSSACAIKLSANASYTNPLLQTLIINDCNIDELDVTYLTAIKTLKATNCPSLTSVKGIENLSLLETIDVSGSGITGLDLSSNTALEELYLYDNTSLSTLNASNTKLSGLSIDDTYTSLSTVTLNNIDSPSGIFSISGNSIETVMAKNINVRSFGVTSISVTTIDLTGATIGTSGGMGEFSLSNCSALTALTISDSNISSLPTETMSALKTLNAENCEGLTYLSAYTMPAVQTVDISGCVNITSLDFSSALTVTSLDASGCSALDTLELGNNAVITDLNVSGCTNITEIDVSACTSLVNLNVSGTAITALEANQSLYMETVDASDCTSLEGLVMDQSSNNNLTSIDVSGCTSMMYMQISNSNSLQELNLSGLTSLSAAYIDNCTAITSIDISNTRMSDIASLNISALSNFKSLKASDADLSDSELAGMLKDTLEVIDISGNSSVTTIDLSGFVNLKTLDVSNSGITELDVSDCLNLETVDAGDCTQLDYFVMSTGDVSEYTGLTSVNISGCTSMTMIHLSDAPNLEIFELSGLANLTEVYVQNCPKITSLDLSSATKISLINVVDSGLTSGSVALPAGKDESIITGLS